MANGMSRRDSVGSGVDHSVRCGAVLRVAFGPHTILSLGMLLWISEQMSPTVNVPSRNSKRCDDFTLSRRSASASGSVCGSFVSE